MEQVREQALDRHLEVFSPQRAVLCRDQKGKLLNRHPEGAAPPPGKAGWDASRVGLVSALFS